MKTAALVLVGAVALSSVAYGVGTQIGGGSADAANESGSQDRGRWRGGPGLGDLAKELGVSASELRKAFRDFHEQNGDERRQDFAAALAQALGKSTEEVEAALEKVEGQRGFAPWRGLNRLADALGVSRAQLLDALREVRGGADRNWKEDRDELVQFLADRFNLSEDKVRDALAKAPKGGPCGPGRGGPGGPMGMGGPPGGPMGMDGPPQGMDGPPQGMDGPPAGFDGGAGEI